MKKAGRQSAVCNGTTAARLTSYGSTSVSDSEYQRVVVFNSRCYGFLARQWLKL